MNPKIFVGIAIATFVAILGGILLMGPTMIVESQDETLYDTQNAIQVEPLQIELEDISVTKISQRSATIKIAFKISNPNSAAVIVQTMDYQLFETSFSESEQISGGEIGSRPEGMLEFGSNYYVLLGDNSIILKDTISLKNSGNTPELWTHLEDNSATWRITGDVFYNLSSMTSGQENELHFEFIK
ncbi:MAG TPA: hypothetical protein OQH54_00560 [Nitrosopumilus sp.]|nr:hypothetical protein [Thermoproteota archaeon]HJJ22199.1 hypothetical protein [Nitrosopumilus sp.]